MKDLKRESNKSLDIINVKLNEEGKYEVLFTNVPIPIKMNKKYLDQISESMNIDYRQYLSH